MHCLSSEAEKNGYPTLHFATIPVFLFFDEKWPTVVDFSMFEGFGLNDSFSRKIFHEIIHWRWLESYTGDTVIDNKTYLSTSVNGPISSSQKMKCLLTTSMEIVLMSCCDEQASDVMEWWQNNWMPLIEADCFCLFDSFPNSNQTVVINEWIESIKFTGL